MNIDGYVLLRVNQHDYRSNEGKAEVVEKNFIDHRFQLMDFMDEDIAEQLVGQLPDELKDVLVMCFIKYDSQADYDYWSGATEYEDVFNLHSHTVIQHGYKEFMCRQITEELDVGINGYENIQAMPDGKNYYKELIGDWEEFYLEDFVPTPNGKSEQVLRFGNKVLGIDWGKSGDRSVLVEAEIDGDGKYIIKQIREV
jgi:hypothetical protein